MTAVPIAASDLQIAAGRRRRERVVKLFFTAAAVLSIVISVAIILSLVGNALTFFISVDKASLWTDGWFPRRGLFDIKTIVVGTLVISAVAMLVATPLGLGAGIYLSEYASPRVRRSTATRNDRDANAFRISRSRRGGEQDARRQYRCPSGHCVDGIKANSSIQRPPRSPHVNVW